MRLLLGKRILNLPQICSVLVIFSLVILLGFGSIEIAEAVKSSGVYQTEISSSKVCGDRLCDIPMSTEEKIAEFRAEPEEQVFRTTTIGSTGTDLMFSLAGGIAGIGFEAIGGAIGGAVFAAVFPNTGDDGYTAALDAMGTEILDALDDQTTIFLAAMDDMEFALIEVIEGTSREESLDGARTRINTWQDEYITYITVIEGAKKNDLEGLLLQTMNYQDFHNEVLSHLTIEGGADDKLVVEGFPLYWMGQLFYIAYLQDRALIDPRNDDPDPNKSTQANLIPIVLAEMDGDLTIAKEKAKSLMETQITAVVCEEVKKDITLRDIPLDDRTSDGRLDGETLDKYTFKDENTEYCWVQDGNKMDVETGEPLKWEKWSSKISGIAGKCIGYGKITSDYGDNWQYVEDRNVVGGKFCKLIIKSYTITSEYVYPVTTQQNRELLNGIRDYHISRYNDIVDVKFLPYEDGLKVLNDNLSITPVPLKGTISEHLENLGVIITEEMDEEITFVSVETTAKFCDQMSISELINSGNYNVVDNRQASSAQVVDGTNEKDLYLASSHGDTFIGKGGNDCIIGGEGNDNLQGRGGNDQLYGRDGNDVLTGNSENDKLYGGDGHDILSAGSGNDLLQGGSGNDELYGRGGHDDLRGGDGDDKLYGGDGDDTLRGGSGNDWLEGGSGNDKLFGRDGINEIDTCTDPDDNTVIQEC